MRRRSFLKLCGAALAAPLALLLPKREKPKPVYTTEGLDRLMTLDETDFSGSITQEDLDRAFAEMKPYPRPSAYYLTILDKYGAL